MNDSLYVIYEQCIEDGKTSVLGVADSSNNALRMITEYYGNHKIIDVRHVMESGIEIVMTISVDHGKSLGGTTEYNLTIFYFKLNTL